MSVIKLDTIEDLQKYESEENFQKLKEANKFDGQIYKEIIEKFNCYLKNLPQEEPEIEKVEFIIQYKLEPGESFGIKGKQASKGTNKKINMEDRNTNGHINGITSFI